MRSEQLYHCIQESKLRLVNVLMWGGTVCKQVVQTTKYQRSNAGARAK